MGIYLNQNNDLLTDDRKKKIYIDKSNIIIHTNAYIDEAEKYICVSRPRRFGKSMAANMLVAYYSRGCDSRKLFSDLEISKDPTFEKHLNKYNVIHLDMNDYDYCGKSGMVFRLEDDCCLKQYFSSGVSI